MIIIVDVARERFTPSPALSLSLFLEHLRSTREQEPKRYISISISCSPSIYLSIYL